MLFLRCSPATCPHSGASLVAFNAEAMQIASFLAEYFHCRVQCIAGELTRNFNLLQRQRPSLGSPAQFVLRNLRSKHRQVLERIRREEEEAQALSERMQNAIAGTEEVLVEEEGSAEADQEGMSILTHTTSDPLLTCFEEPVPLENPLTALGGWSLLAVAGIDDPEIRAELDGY